MKKTLTFLYFLLLTKFSVGQITNNWHWNKLPISNHFSIYKIQSLHKDKDGIVWIASGGRGIYEFDSKNIKHHINHSKDALTLSSNYIQGSIFEFNERFWVTTYTGINAYDKITKNFKQYTIHKNNESIKSGYRALGRDKNLLYLLYNNTNIYSFDLNNQQFQLIKQVPTYSEQVHIFGKSIIYQDTTYTFTYKYKSSKTLHLDRISDNEFICSKDIVLRKNKYEEIIIKKIIPSKSTLWIQTNLGIAQLDLSTLNYNFIDLKSLTKKFSSFHPINDNELLIGTNDGKIYTFNTKENEYRLLQTLKDKSTIDYIFQDKDQGIWIHKKNDGIYFSHPYKTKFDNLIGNESTHRIIETTNQRLALFTENTFSLWKDKDSLLHQIPKQGKKYISTIYAFPCRNSIYTNYNNSNEWINTENLWDISKTTFQEHIADTLHIGAAYADQDNHLYLAVMHGGIIIVDKGEKTPKATMIPNTKNLKNINYLQELPNNLFLASHNLTKLSFYKKNNFQLEKSYPLTSDIYGSYQSANDSILWLATDNGLISFNHITERFDYFTQENGLPANLISGLIPWKSDLLWLSTEKGLCTFNTKNKSVQVFNKTDGLTSESFNTRSFTQLSDGRMVFGHNKGALIFHPDSIYSRIPLALPNISKITIDDQTIKNQNHHQSKIILPPGTKKVKFDFTAIEYSNPSSNKIRYRLLPDSAWTTIPSGGYGLYNSLLPGRYLLEIQAANSDNVWNTNSKKVKIIAQPTFWQTSLFKGLVVLFFISIVAGIVYANQKRKQHIQRIKYAGQIALERQRLRIARDMHDDLGSRISALGLRTAMLEAKVEHPEWKTILHKITDETQSLAVNIRETIWTVDAKNDTLEQLIDYLQKYGETTFEETDINFRFAHTPQDIPTIMLSGEVRRMVFLAYKEVLNNAIKHAKAHLITVNLIALEEKISITIKDDGIGFDTNDDDNANGNGLNNMQFRMQRIKGYCEISSTPKLGTTTILSFPIRKKNLL